MFPLYSLDEFLAMSEDDFCADELINLINLYDENDPLHERVRKAPLSENYLWVACHANASTFAVVLYAGEHRVAYNDISPTKMANRILNSGLWTGQDIVFLSCNAGVPGGPAQTVAELLDTDITVHAPKTLVFFKESGFFYVSDCSLPADSPELEPDVQATRWNKY